MPKRTDFSKNVLVSLSYTGALGLCCLAMASWTVGECVTVEPNYEPASAHVRIGVVRDGKPMKNVSIEMEGTGGQKGPVLLTNGDGIVMLSTPRPGQQCVTATAPDNAAAQLCLDVSSKSRDKVSSFSIEMPLSPTMQEMVKAEKMPVLDHVQAFMGIVQDFSGAVVAGTKIQILPKGSKDEANATRIEVDPAGHFSAPLPDGVYMAFFQSSGFVTKTEVFEVGKKFGLKDLRISLTIGHC
jgi:hypothetical protein